MKFESLDDRMKFYESASEKRLLPLLPVLVRLDGVGFHRFTKGLSRPYDLALSKCMIETTEYLCKLTNARAGYTQSDEITLLLYSDSVESQIYRDGRIGKITSILAAECSNEFDRRRKIWNLKPDVPAQVFDCRVWNVPTQFEATNVFVWREQDATRNSVSMAGFAHFSQPELFKLSVSKVQEKLFEEKGINWNDYPDHFKRGTYVFKRAIPIHINSPFVNNSESTTIWRSRFIKENPPIITKWTNRVGVLFDGEQPELADD
jgi:tRNA(His) guanylyltransferase